MGAFFVRSKRRTGFMHRTKSVLLLKLSKLIRKHALDLVSQILYLPMTLILLFKAIVGAKIFVYLMIL